MENPNALGDASDEQDNLVHAVLRDGTILRAAITLGRASSVPGMRTARYTVLEDPEQGISSTGEVYFFFRVKGDDLEDAKSAVRRLLQATAF